VSARVVYTGRTSMHITVDVASGQPGTRALEPATRCLMIFVSVDDKGSSTPVRELVPRTLGEELEQQWAMNRVALRREVEAAMAGEQYTDAGSAPRVVLRFLAAPTDVNWGGKVHGGIVMRWIDEAAHVLATQWTGNANNVAIFTGGVRFYRPLRIGHVVEVEARLLHTGTTSMHIGVHVRSGDPTAGADGMELTTFCRTVFVGIDEQRRALHLPHVDARHRRGPRPGRPRRRARRHPRPLRQLTHPDLLHSSHPDPGGWSAIGRGVRRRGLRRPRGRWPCAGRHRPAWSPGTSAPCCGTAS
jgi:acyl-CoA hydrolase